MQDRFHRILKQYWGYDSFRPLQEDIIRSIDANIDTLALMPTGGGKSITFQVPALARDGLCLVVTPLVSLMRDQVQHLREKNILAATIFSEMGSHAIENTLSRCLYGNVKLLYISPERLGNETFRNMLPTLNISMIAVDEAHCISQWGYDFRPAYLKIAEIRDLLPHVPILALTATATPDVIDDIKRQLHFRDNHNTFRKSFGRSNLHYIVRQVEDKPQYLLRILRSIRDGAVIIYTSSRARTRDIATFLGEHDFPAEHFHAGLTSVKKNLIQEAWSKRETNVIVATNAFGMGIDRPDVRAVIHIDVPDSIESYFQEAGRAGRDGNESYAVLLFNRKDESTLMRHIADRFPSEDQVRRVYAKLCYYLEIGVGEAYEQTFPVDVDTLCYRHHLMPNMFYGALRMLQSNGYLQLLDENDNASKLRILVSHEDLYQNWGLTPNEEETLDATMRMYTGLFTDHAYVNEDDIAARMGTDRQSVYTALRGLTFKGIVSYIPYKRAPLVKFLTPRLDESRIVTYRDTTLQQKRIYEHRIRSIIDYANARQCRSQFLLRYFGESDATPCGNCDYCREH
ncbi:MAG: RecQ family ATP-dependent DNA helicase [Paludibacteraceae bacterium]|nr:RecQ family ATP-dependent DNA helicase [Paludibacteraceae bacterium]